MRWSKMHRIISVECSGCRGEVCGWDIRGKRIEFRIEIHIIWVWKICVILEIGIGKIIIRISGINWILGIIIIRGVGVY